jgi:LPXTG-motif cell wall-anchored protein
LPNTSRQKSVLNVIGSALISSSLLFASPALGASQLVGDYTFEDLDFTGLAIDSATGNNGEAFGDPTPTSSEDVPNLNRANTTSAQFDGQNYFQINNTVGNDFSVCAWIKTESIGGPTHWTSSPIVDSESGGWALDFGFGINSQGKLIFGNGGLDENEGGYDSHVDGNSIVNDSQWHHVCATRSNANGTVKLYVDRALDASGTTGKGVLTSNPLIKIGNGSDGNQPFVGLIDELKIYDYVLTEDEVAELTAIEETLPSTPTELADTGLGSDQSGMLLLSFALVGLGVVLLRLAKKN